MRSAASASGPNGPPCGCGSGGRKPTWIRLPSGSRSSRSAASVGESRRTSPPQPSQTTRPARAKSSRRWSWISVAVATVERGLRESVRWRIAIAGQIPETSSTRGFSIRSRNWRA